MFYGILDTETKSFTPKEGGQSPWGKIQGVEMVTPWMTFAYTASHGGYKIDRKHNAMIPAYLRQAGGWYEEDCHWAIVFCVLEDKIRADMSPSKSRKYEVMWEDADTTFKGFYPDLYERYNNSK